jgi:PKD repeat protein
MLFSIRYTTALLLTGAVLGLAACQKDRKELEGPVPTANFTYTLDTSQFPVVVTFTNTSTDGFLYQWDFGDGSPLVSGKSVTHTYTLPRSYAVKLVVAGRGGSASYSPPTEIVIPSACGNVAFQTLTGCGNGAWTYSDQPGAIQTLAANGVTVLASSTAPLPECQEDDLLSFSNTFTYVYDEALSCDTSPNHPIYSGSTGFTFRETTNGLGQITLSKRGSFIGLPDTTRNRTYDIIEASANRLRLRGTNANGTFTVVTLMPPLPPLQRAERLLTGGSSRTWMLDNTVPQTILVGTSANPAEYSDSDNNPLAPCQLDDEYTFTSSHNLTYDAKAQTFVGGGANEPTKYACLAPRPYTTSYTFSLPSGAGLAQLLLNNSSAFIGTTDASANRIYRILSINSRQMVIRGGEANGTLFTFKMRVK